MIYVATWGPYVKIGYSRSPERRMRDLPYGTSQTPRLDVQTVGIPVLVGAFEGDRGAETLLHLALAAHRVSGEWFDGTAPLVQAIVAETARRHRRLQKTRRG
jgi:hypothetical protein